MTIAAAVSWPVETAIGDTPIARKRRAQTPASA